jgi:Amt family ammonium transporter
LFHHDGFRWAQLATQLIGVVACFAWTFTTVSIALRIMRATIGLRVSFDAEIEGLDWAEHAAEGYPPDFVPTSPVPGQPGREYAHAE